MKEKRKGREMEKKLKKKKKEVLPGWDVKTESKTERMYKVCLSTLGVEMG